MLWNSITHSTKFRSSLCGCYRQNYCRPHHCRSLCRSLPRLRLSSIFCSFRGSYGWLLRPPRYDFLFSLQTQVICFKISAYVYLITMRTLLHFRSVRFEKSDFNLFQLPLIVSRKLLWKSTRTTPKPWRGLKNTFMNPWKPNSKTIKPNRELKKCSETKNFKVYT